MAQDKRQKNRVPIGAQLIVGQDDDLIRWVGNLERGQRQAAIKAALRKGLGMKRQKPQPSEIDTLRADMEAAKEWAASINTEMEILRGENTELRGLVDGLQANGFIASAAAARPEAANGQRLDDETTARRRATALSQW